MPFGEYIPLRKIFPFFETVVPIGDFSRGNEYSVFAAKPGKPQFSVLICFEDVFPELAAGFVRRGADFLINITNDAWFKDTLAPYQHLQASVFRAVENRVPVVRAANTGVSAFISASGVIISSVTNSDGKQTFIEGFNTGKICVRSKGLTFYSRSGDWFTGFCLVFALVYLFFNRRKNLAIN